MSWPPAGPIDELVTVMFSRGGGIHDEDVVLPGAERGRH
jgi:hypothetical protein